MKREKDGDAFAQFSSNPPKGNSLSDSLLLDYEKHYMQLLAKYKDEIAFVNGLLKSLRDEAKETTELITDLDKKFDNQEIDPEVKSYWFKHLSENLSSSFKLSEDFISHFIIMEKDQFMTELRRRITD